jgi:predicted O-methyltransferase YrrM
VNGYSLSSLARGAVVRLLDTIGIDLGPLTTRTNQKVIERLLDALDPRFRAALLSMYRGEPQLGSDGRVHPIDTRTRISPSQGMWLYDVCVSTRPASTLEIGMAYGYSTLYFLAALAKNGSGHHTAIDPLQHSYYRGIGLAHAHALAPSEGVDSRLRLIEDRSDRVATDLARANSTFDIIFIDGSHRFDDVLTDFYLYAPLCEIGGHIVFDDMWMRSVQTAVAFVRKNREDFLEIRTAERNICAFLRVGHDSRSWNHFHEFHGRGVFRLGPVRVG